MLTLRLLARNRLTLVCLIGVLALCLLAIVGPYVVPYPESIYGVGPTSEQLQPPSLAHPFGTDELARDIFSRVIYGTRISLTTALVAVALALVIGVPLGAVAGTAGRLSDEGVMRVTDIFLAFPPLLFALLIAAYLGPSLRNATIAIAISWWPWYTRLVRSQAVSLSERQYVKAAKASGVGLAGVIRRHIVPNAMAPIVVQASMDIGIVILTLAALSFLGLGAQPPTPEWGLMVSQSRSYFLTAWWYTVFPGLAVFVTVLCFTLLGDGLREVLDPRTRYQ
jgi:peptide/nickel transport system permease protein